MAAKYINNKGEVYEEENVDINILRHTTSHVLAQAIKRIYPDAKLAIGPAIDTGFYYDVELTEKMTQEDLNVLEDEMKKIIKENLKIETFNLSREEAIKLMSDKNEDYKIELINDLPEDSVLTFFKQGEFVDLCVGPHLLYTKAIKAFKLLNITGAYWRGDEKNKMLTRIYGTAFANKEELAAELERREEAKKRDHNKLGRELEIFTTIEEIGQGLPILLPKGAKIIQLLQRFVEDEEQKRGYLLTKTPLFAKSDFYKISGHWDHYKEGMFIIGDEEKDKEVFALRPMTCPFQYMAYKNRQRSYRDLPLRYNETSTLFRKEESGEMHGLIRVRQFTISEAHLVVRPDQLEEEVKGCIELTNYFMDVLGLKEDISYRFSKWDPNDKEKYMGTAKDWDEAQNSLKKILDDLKLDYVEADGEAAFYGPKLDVQCKNVWGKEDTIITIQLDIQLAHRFEMTYVDSDGEKKYPFIIHRTSMGCYERTLAMLIEKYAGALPLWIAPNQIQILPITENELEYAKKLQLKLQAEGFRVEVDSDDQKIGYKIRAAQLEKVPYMLILGKKEVESNTISFRKRTGEQEDNINVEDFVQMLQTEINTSLKK